MEPAINFAAPVRVLLVEDECLISEWMAEALSDQGFVVRAVTNAADALRYLGSAPVDVLFTDINLVGDMDGVTLAHRARELLPHLPVVYASARANRLDPRVLVPGSIFVSKPYLPEMVGRLLAEASNPIAECVPA